jgi:hypothetical protein
LYLPPTPLNNLHRDSNVSLASSRPSSVGIPSSFDLYKDCSYQQSVEAKKMLEDIQLADHDVGIMDREAAEVLKVKFGFLFFL